MSDGEELYCARCRAWRSFYWEAYPKRRRRYLKCSRCGLIKRREVLR